MLARIMVDDTKRMALILVRKKLLLAFCSFLRRHKLRIPKSTRKMYENEVKKAMTLVFGLEITMVSTSLILWM